MKQCPHLPECWLPDSDEEDAHCPWCKEVRDLEARIACLRDECLGKLAVQVYGGTSRLVSDSFGLVQVYGGTVVTGRETTVDLVSVKEGERA